MTDTTPDTNPSDTPVTLSATAPPQPRVRLPITTRNLPLWIIAFIAIIFALKWSQEVLIPLFLAIFISYVLDPLVTLLAKARLPRPLGAGLVLIVIVAGLGYTSYNLRDEAQNLLSQIPETAHKISHALRENRKKDSATFSSVEKAASELERVANANVPPAMPGVMRVQVVQPNLSFRTYLWWGSMSAIAATVQGILVLFLVYFMLATGDLYKRKLLRLTGPSLSKKRVTVQILQEINKQIERFLLVQIVTSVLVAVATWLAFKGLGLRHADIWAIIAGLLHSIPYFGPGFVTLGAGLVAFLQSDGLDLMLTVTGISLVINSIAGFVIAPWLTSRAARMNAVAVFVSLLFWGWLWGIWGLLLGIPIMMMLKAIADRVEGLKPLGELLGD